MEALKLSSSDKEQAKKGKTSGRMRKGMTRRKKEEKGSFDGYMKG